MAIDKNSKAYQSLLNSGYTDEQIMQMHQQVASWQNASQVVANTPKGSTSTSTNTSSTPRTNTYQNQGAGNYTYNPTTWYYENTSNQNAGSSTNTSWGGRTNTNTYQNQWAGNYTYNPTSWYYEKTNNQTSTPANTSSNLNTTRQYWEGLTYEQQQEKFNQIPWLKESLTKKWWTIKSPNGQWWQQTTQTQANPWQWDYQDNSDARMYEIASNLNGYRVSNPELFSDWNTFSNFFINGKWRSQEQIDFLKSYFNSVKQYNSYDNMSAPTVWEMVAKWEIPDDYLNYLKYSNPDRYAEVMNYKDMTEKGIMNETYYSNLVANSNDPNWMKWAKENSFLIDENNDNLDDRLYHAPTEEEQNLVNEYSTLASEQLADQNTYRDLMSDLREQYPDADESTLMILAWDRGKKIQDRMDTRNVTMTKLWGQITYLQNERTTQNTAWQQTINQLQKAFWMYYDYSAEWMAEMAQNQYAATNVTLDQADNWTDAQKQMALQSVLDDYYSKYWSIIQRSEAQVINDVMAYARNNWVTLSQALEENFLKPLRAKPQFSTLSSGGELWYNPKIYKIWDNRYWYFDQNGNLIEIWGWASTIWGWTSGWEWFTNYTPISEEDKKNKLSSFMGSHPEWATWWECWSFVNDYLQSLWYSRWIGNDISTKKAIKNSDTATVWSVAIMNSSKHPSNWHVAIVTAINWDKVKLLESNWNDDHKVHTTRWVKKSDIYWYFDPSKSPSAWNAWNWGNYDPSLEPFLKADPTKFTSTQWKAINNMWYTEKQFMQIRNGYLKNLASSPDAATKKILDTIWSLIKDYPWELALKSTMLWTDYVNNKLWNYISNYDFVKQNLTMDNLTKLKANWATFGSLTEWERPRIENSASKLNKNKMSESAFKRELLDIYNTYAEKAGMGTLTLDDIYNMYSNTSWSWTAKSFGSSSSSSSSSSSWGKKITNLGR